MGFDARGRYGRSAGLHEHGLISSIRAEVAEQLHRAHTLRLCVDVADLLTLTTHMRGEPSMLTDFERAAVEHVLARLDAALATIPMHRDVRAVERLLHVAVDGSMASPIPRE